MSEAHNLTEVTVQIAHYVRAYDSYKVKVTPEQEAELKEAFEEGEEPSGHLVEEIFQNGELIGSFYDGTDDPWYEVIYFEK